jgi:hypothetical protein
LSNASREAFQTLSEYAWCDGKKTVSIYLEHGEEIPAETTEEDVETNLAEDSRTLEVILRRAEGRLALKLPLYLKGECDSVSCKIKSDKVVIVLKKKEEEAWSTLKENKE